MISGKWLVVITVAVGGTFLVAYSGLRNSEHVTLPDAARRPSRPIPAICDTDVCSRTTEYLKQLMNTSVDPCTDFYQFTCGGFIKDHPVGQEDEIGVYSVIYEQASKLNDLFHIILNETVDSSDPGPVNSAKLLYKSCMDYEQREKEGIQPLVDLTNEFGGWPILSDQWEGDNLTASEIIQLTQRWLVSPLTQFLSTPYVQQLDGKIYIKVQSTFFNHNLMVTQRDIYELSIKKHVELFMNESEYLRLAEKIEEDVDQIVEFETALYNISHHAIETPSIWTFEDLKVWCDRLDLMNISQKDWSSLLISVLSNVGVTEYDEEDVAFEDVGFLLGLVQLLSNTPRRVIANTMHWRIVQVMVLFTNGVEEIKDYNYYIRDSTTVITAATSEEVKKEYCGKIITNNLRNTIAYEFVTTAFAGKEKTFADNLVKNVRSAFNSRIRNADWIDDENKALVIEKADSMKMLIGYPEWYDKPSALENYYKELNCTENYFKNWLNLLHVENRRMLRDKFDPSGKLVDKYNDREADNFLDVFNDAKHNTVKLTAGLLMPPIFLAEGHVALNYGRAGTIVGHEVSHSFDIDGGLYDKSGEKRVWWNPSLNESYAERNGCFLRQYDSYRSPRLDDILKKRFTIDGWNTLAENMADNSGLSTAFLAYQEYVKQNGPEPRLPGLEEYSPEQLFYIGYGTLWCSSENAASLEANLKDVHAPAEARVMVPLFNSEDFAREFKCPVGSRMNPEKKCLLW